MKSAGAVRGTAMHALMQYLRYENCTDDSSVRMEIDRLIRDRYISKEQGEMVDVHQIAAFFATELGEKLRHHPNVLREFKFSILDDAAQYDPSLAGEEILLQGVMDCAMVDEDGITVMDFKTDYVTEETLPEKGGVLSAPGKGLCGCSGPYLCSTCQICLALLFPFGEVCPSSQLKISMQTARYSISNAVACGLFLF